MHRVRIAVGLLFALLLCSAAPIALGSPIKRAAYFIDNNPAGETVVALKISAKNGRLSSPVRTPTGGVGEFAIDALGVGGPDSLFGSGSVVVGDNYLFAVNPGSNSLSMFCIDPEDPWHPTLVGAPADTLGDFPMSVAYSSKLNIACALNGGEIAGVTCFSVDETTGLAALDSYPRSLEESIHQTTSPPIGLNRTTSHVFFNPSSTALFAIVKGNSSGVNQVTPGYFFVWPVENGQISRTPIISRVPGAILPYSGVFLGSDSRLFITDPVSSTAILDVSASFEITAEVQTPVPNEVALCWAAYSPVFNSIYSFDSRVAAVTISSPESGAIKGVIPFDQGVMPMEIGAFDAAINRKWMYFLVREAAVVVVDLSGAKSAGVPSVVQRIDLSALGSRKGWEGMAIYPSW